MCSQLQYNAGGCLIQNLELPCETPDSRDKLAGEVII